MLVRYGRLGHLGWFEHDENQIPKVHSKVLIKTERGLELGEIVGPFCYRAGNFRLAPEAVDQYFEDGGLEQSPKKAGEFVRFATAQDVNEDMHLRRDGAREMETARKLAQEHNVPIDIVDVEHIFGGERIVFYFVAESRVDFRELVRLLAKEYQTRIEMRQIGSRDEAKLMSDYETCGRECCCSRFMRILKPVNMRMAKLQKATLDPSKISGYCGRLKCCLRFEDDTYRELRDRLPKRGTRIKTREGMGTVVDGHILAQLVVLQMDAGGQVAIPLEDINGDGTVVEASAKAEVPAAADMPFADEQVEDGPEPRAMDEIADDVVGDIEARYEREDDAHDEETEVEEEIRQPAPEAESTEPERKPAMKWAPVGGAKPQERGGVSSSGEQRGDGRNPQGGAPGQEGRRRRRGRRRNRHKNQWPQGQQQGPHGQQGSQGQQRSDNGS